MSHKGKRCLVLCGGGLKGAYGAGASATLCRHLGSSYFDEIRVASVGVFAGTFYIANQPDVIEDVWRNHVSGNKLFNIWHPVSLTNPKWFLDVDYLIDLFQKERSNRLDIDAFLSSSTKLVVPLTSRQTGETSYSSPTNSDEIFSFMRAASAVPFTYRCEKMGQECYIDGGLFDPIPLPENLDDYESVLLVSNKPIDARFEGMLSNSFFKVLFALSPYYLNLVTSYRDKVAFIEKTMSHESNISLIAPQHPLPIKNMFDTRKTVINESFSMGEEDARAYLSGLGDP